ncbi:MAG: hypothetical protein HRF49_03095 [bacterium]|jgi:uncharacterized membrane-anchored protein
MKQFIKKVMPYGAFVLFAFFLSGQIITYLPDYGAGIGVVIALMPFHLGNAVCALCYYYIAKKWSSNAFWFFVLALTMFVHVVIIWIYYKIIPMSIPFLGLYLNNIGS